MEFRLIVKVVTSSKPDGGASYDSVRGMLGSLRQLLNDRSQKNFAVRECDDEL